MTALVGCSYSAWVSRLYNIKSEKQHESVEQTSSICGLSQLNDDNDLNVMVFKCIAASYLIMKVMFTVQTSSTDFVYLDQIFEKLNCS